MKNTLSLALLCALLFWSFDAGAQFRPDYLGSDTSDNINGMSFLTPSTGFVALDKFVGFTQDSGKTFIKRTITLGNVNYNGYSVGLTFGFEPQGVVAFSTDSILVYGHFSFEPSILFSADQGQTWKLVYHQPLNPSAPVLSSGITDIEFPGNGSVGFAVHDEGVVRTTDRGQNWVPVLNATNQQLRKLSFPTTAAGYVAGGGLVYKATNTGANWTSVAPTGFPYTPSFNNIFFTSPTNGYVMEQGTTTIFRTTDGAATWKPMNDPTLIPIQGNDLFFTNDSTGYVATDLYAVAKTVNYGKTWELCKNSSPYQFLYYGMNAVYFYNSLIGWAGGDGEYLMITSNGGPTVPKAYFKIDSTNLWQTDSVKLVNYSNTGYQYQWYRNDTLLGTTYNLEYAHAIFRKRDTITLIVRNGADADTMTSYIGFPPPVLVYSFSPAQGATGTVITIKGTGFSGATQVSFGGVAASAFTVVNDSVITATVGLGAGGTIAVRTPNGTGTITGFTYAGPPAVNMPLQVADSIVCKSGPVSLTIQNTESGVTYTMIDSLGNAYGTASGNGGTITLTSTPVSIPGHYSIQAVRTSTGVSATFTNKFFLLVEHPLSAFSMDKLNVLTGEAVTYINRSLGASSFQWTFNQDASSGGSTSPVVPGIVYGSAGQKTLSLISTSVNGCPDTVTGNAVFVYTSGSPSNACYAEAVDQADTIWPNLVYQSFGDISAASNDGFMICGSGNESVVNGRAGASAMVAGSSTVYANYSANGVLRFTDYITQGSGSIGSSAVDASGNIYLTGIANSAAWFHFSNGDSMQIYVAALEKQPVWSKNNGFIMKLDPNGRYLWHTIIYDQSAIYQGYPVQGGQGTKIRVFGNRVIVMGSFLANLAYVRNGVQTVMYALPNDVYPNDLQNNFILDVDTSGAFQWVGHTHNAAVNDLYSLSDVGMDGQGNAYIVGNYEGGMQLFDAANALATFSGNVGSEHGWVVKLDPTGHKIWSTHMDLAYNYREVPLNDIAVDVAGNYYVVGNTALGDTTQYFVVNNSDNTTVQEKLSGWFVAKFNSAGILQWMQGNKSGSGGTGYAVTLNGNDVYALGSYINNSITDYPVTVTSGGGGIDSVLTTGTEMFLAKYTTDGVLERVNRSGGNVGGHIYGNGLFVDSHGNVVMGGLTDYYNGGNYQFQFFGGNLASRATNVWYGKLDPGFCMVSANKPVDAGADRTICFGDSSVLGGNLAGDTVYWTSSPAGFVSRSPNPVVRPGVTTKYYVSLNNSDGTVSMDSVTVTVRPAYNYAGAAASICAGGSDTLGIAGGGAVQYTWGSIPAGFSANDPRPVVSPIATTSYFLKTLDSWGCATSDTVVVTVNRSSIGVIPSLDTAVCAGQQLVIGQPDAVDRWVWHSSPAGFSSTSSQPAVTAAVSTVYYGMITDPNGCTGADTVAVRVKALPDKPVISLVDSVTLASSAVSGNQWYQDTAVITGAVMQRYQPGDSGLYSVRVTDSGCVSPYAVNYKYVPPASPSTPVTPNDSVWVNIGPNPVGNVLYLTFHVPGISALTVEIVDFHGQTVLMQSNVASGGMIYIYSLPKGVYGVKVWDDSGKVRVVKLVLKL